MRLRIALLTLAMTAAVAADPACAEPITAEVWFSVTARVRTPRTDADLEAGGKLEMTGRRGASGGLELTLARVLEAPWKLYWVDPLGPFGEEVKVASVLTLPETSWEALDSERAANAIQSKKRHASWFEQAERSRNLDGAFAFIVIGQAHDRFGFEVGASASVTKVSNRLTNRWLPGPFDQFIGGRSDRPGSEPDPEGYWFWNDGEEQPPGFEPHTYHGFAAALELLALPLPPPPGRDDESVSWADAGRRARRVLEILAPKAARRVPASPPLRLGARDVLRTRQADGSLRLEIEVAEAREGLRIRRETVFSQPGRPAGDRLRLEIVSGRGRTLKIDVGYEVLDPLEDSE